MHLRPLGFGEILDGAFAIYRRHFSTLFLTALLPYLPVLGFWIAFALIAAGNTPDVVTMLIGVSQLILIPFAFLAPILVWGAIIHQAAQAYMGGEVSLRDGYARALRRFFPLLAAYLVAVVLIIFGFILLIVPGILLTIMFFAIGPAAVIEQRGPLESLGRSRELARGAWGRIFGILFVLFLIIALPSFAIGVGSAIGLGFSGAAEAQAAAERPWIYSAVQALNVLIGALTTPFMATGVVLLYYDRRVRSEALDLELATESLSASY